MTLWAVLPVKEMAGSKQRLSPLLSPAERVALMRVMVGEVLDALARRARPGRCRGGDAGCLDHGGGASAAARG